jgi:hypothetical protein
MIERGKQTSDLNDMPHRLIGRWGLLLIGYDSQFLGALHDNRVQPLQEISFCDIINKNAVLRKIHRKRGTDRC